LFVTLTCSSEPAEKTEKTESAGVDAAPATESAADADLVAQAVRRLTTEILDLERDFEAQDELAASAARAIEQLAGRGPAEEVTAALEPLARAGDSAALRALLAARAAKPDQAPAEQAKAYTALGAAAYADDRAQSVAAYRSAAELDPSAAVLRELGFAERPHERFLGDEGDAVLAPYAERTKASHDTYQRLLALGTEQADRAAQAEAYAGLGFVTSRAGDGREQLDRALPLERELGRQARVAHLTRALAEHSLFLEQDPAVAERQYREALAIDESLGRKAAVAHTYGQLARLFARSGDNESFESTLKTCASLAQSQELKRLELKCRLGLASLYAILERKDEARAALDAALGLSAAVDPQQEIAEQFVDVAGQFEPEDLHRAYMHAKGLYRALGKPEEASSIDELLAELEKPDE
jgi:tetratricopeptide (TPR) repeat protein